MILTSTIVIRALRTREATDGPCKWTTIYAHECTLLLETEPWYMLLCKLYDLGCVMTEVCLVRSAVIVASLCED